MDIPHNFDNNFFDGNNLPDINKIVIDKRIRSLKNLKKSERELVFLCYKEAVMKGFVLEDIQKYIALKTRLWIEKPLLHTIKKRLQKEDLAWYYNFIQSSMHYIGIYRKHVDEINLFKKELWQMLEDPDITAKNKIKIFGELHQLSRTSVLLIRDLPFVSNLSRYFQYIDGNVDEKREI
jgi:hypothetical protein